MNVNAQSSALNAAWKNQPQTVSETSTKITDATTAAPPSAVIEKNNAAPATTVASAWSFKPPVEPTVKPANPALDLNAEKTAVLEKNSLPTPADDLVGVDPPRTFSATAYSLRGRTRSGTYVRRGVIAADPRVLPLGSVVHLKAGNYSGVYTVHDTGGAIKGKIIDVWMPSSHEARSFGRRSVKLTVLKYGRGGKAAKK